LRPLLLRAASVGAVVAGDTERVCLRFQNVTMAAATNTLE
jgi:hypothetical protein